MVSRGERPPARASARLLRGREAVGLGRPTRGAASSPILLGPAQLSISARFLHGRRRSRAESRPPRGVGAHPAQPACATPARTCAPRARRSRSPPPASQWLALLCLPILRLSLWLSSPPPSWDELQVCVLSVRARVCAPCGERAPPPPIRPSRAADPAEPPQRPDTGQAALPARLPPPAPGGRARPGLLLERSQVLPEPPEAAASRAGALRGPGCLPPSPRRPLRAVSRGRRPRSQPARSGTRRVRGGGELYGPREITDCRPLPSPLFQNRNFWLRRPPPSLGADTVPQCASCPAPRVGGNCQVAAGLLRSCSPWSPSRRGHKWTRAPGPVFQLRRDPPGELIIGHLEKIVINRIRAKH
ncbi:uncharacterized protein LOC123617660 [Camelus bactrianus]|uniref:Uncharacterized protein LOC123617660 n=1 Tax=Camelus bactrianus TaxID=9837 RepID=A0AC58PSE0_CAMBA